jgi:hypothetical protein
MLQTRCRLCFDFGDRGQMFRFAEKMKTAGLIPSQVACQPAGSADWNKQAGVTPANTFVAKEVNDE